MMVTIKDIAKKAKVDPSTVSRALSDSSRVKDATKSRILEICREVGYTPNVIARALVKRDTKIIGMLVPNMANSYYSELMVIAGNQARELGFDIMWYNSFLDEELEKKYFMQLVEYQVNAIIIHPINGNQIDFFRRYTTMIPTVFIGDIPETEGICGVSTDNYKAGMLASSALIHGGCRHLVFIGARNDRTAHIHRVSGFRDQCLQSDVRGVVEQSNIEYKSTTDRAYGMFVDTLDFGESFDGVVAVNDHAAMGIIKACNERGIRIPEDMQLVGFDDLDYSSLPNICLSTVSAERDELISQSMDLIIRMLQEGIICESRSVAPRLIKRKTSL